MSAAPCLWSDCREPRRSTLFCRRHQRAATASRRGGLLPGYLELQQLRQSALRALTATLPIPAPEPHPACAWPSCPRRGMNRHPLCSNHLPRYRRLIDSGAIPSVKPRAMSAEVRAALPESWIAYLARQACTEAPTVVHSQ